MTDSEVSRRRFLSALAAMIAALAARPIVRAEASNVVMAVGGAGSNVAAALLGAGVQADLWIWDRFPRGPAAPRFDVARIIKVREVLDSRRSVDAAWLENELASLPGGHARVALVAGLGGSMGSGLLAVLASALLARGIPARAFCTLPFAFEGKLRGETATQALSALSSTGVRTFVLTIESLLSESKGRSLAEIIGRGNQRLVKEIRRFFAGM